MARQVAARARARSRLQLSPRAVAEAVGGGEAGDRAFRERGPRAAEAGAIAKRVDGRAMLVRQLSSRRVTRWPARVVEIVRGAERAQQLVGGLEALAEADDVDLEAAGLGARDVMRTSAVSAPSVRAMLATAEP